MRLNVQMTPKDCVRPPRRSSRCARKGSPLCTYADFSHVLPVPTSREHILRLSSLGKFPRFIRPSGFKSEPHFLKEEVIGWIRTKYGSLLPEVVDRIEKEGFTKSSSHEGL